MAMPQERSQDIRDDTHAAAVPANTNTYRVIGLPIVESDLTVIEGKLADLENVPLANVAGSIAELRTTVASIRGQIVAAALQAFMRADGGVEITDIPAMPEKGRDGKFQPGEMVPGKGILIGEFDLADAHGRRLGIRTRWYDTVVELGKPMTFNDTAAAVANCNVNGRGGLRLNPERYEAELFETLNTGEALGKSVIAPFEVVEAINELRNTGEYKRLSDGDLPGKVITIAGTDSAHWQWSCTPAPRPDYVRAVDFTDGYGGWSCRDVSRLSSRACFAELVL